MLLDVSTAITEATTERCRIKPEPEMAVKDEEPTTPKAFDVHFEDGDAKDLLEFVRDIKKRSFAGEDD